MLDLPLPCGVEHIDNHLVRAERFERERRNELGRILGHGNAHFGALLAQRRNKFAYFIDGDASGNADHYAFAFKIHQSS